MSDLLDRIVTMIGLLCGAWLYTHYAPRTVLSVCGLVLTVAWGARLVLLIALR